MINKTQNKLQCTENKQTILVFETGAVNFTELFNIF